MVSLCNFRPRWRPARRRRRRALALEPLEPRAVPAVFFVTNFGDAGAGLGDSGDLRYCISQAAVNKEADIIQFASPGTVTLNSTLPDLNDRAQSYDRGPVDTGARQKVAVGESRTVI